MKEAKGDLWEYPGDVRVITTNGFVKKDGRAVMGRGCALQARKLYHDLDRLLGNLLLTEGNHVHYLHNDLVSFPVKHNWWEAADLDLIRQSTGELRALIGGTSLRFVMIRAGCGNGRLTWKQVRPILSTLPDNVTVVDHLYGWGEGEVTGRL